MTKRRWQSSLFDRERPEKTARLFSWLVVCAMVVSSAHAIDSTRFRHLNVEAGLSQDTVQAIVQDHDGFLWLATQHGLNRYDGFEFHTFFSDTGAVDGSDQTGNLPADWIWTLLVDRRGALWVGTEGGGLAVKQRGRQEFETVDHQPDQLELLSGFAVRALEEDHAGNIWIGTDGGGVTRLDPNTRQLHNYRSHEQARHGLASDHVKAIHVDKDGRIWIGTDDAGLYRFTANQDRFQPVQLGGATDNLRVRSIVSESGKIWVGTTEHGLYEFDVVSQQTNHYQAGGDDLDLNSNSIRALLVDRDGVLWVGHDSHGIDRYQGSGQFQSIRTAPADPQSLSDDHVSALFQDAGGIVWVGTMKGTSRWNPDGAMFANFSRTSAHMPITENWISSFADNGDGSYWVGTAGGGINQVDFSAGTVRAVRHDPSNANSLSDDRVFSLAREADTLWVGTRAHGLNRYEFTTGDWQHFRHDPADPNSLSFDGVTTILRHSKGDLWIGTYLGGINRLAPDQQSFQRLQNNPDDPTSLCFDRVVSLFEDRRGMVWVGTHGGGMCVLDPESLTFTTFRHDPSDASSLSSNSAWMITEDLNGNLWVGTADSGLNVWLATDRANGHTRFLRFNRADGLPSPVVYGLVTDHGGDVWMSSNRGLARLSLDPQTNALNVRHLRKADGLQGSEFNFAAALVGHDGRLLFGGTDGFTTFYTHALTTTDYAAPINLTGVYGADGNRMPRLADQPFELGFDQPVVTFEYAAMDFAAPESVSYERMLVGFDEDWMNDGNRRRATYTNLAAGDYVFRVRTLNSDGVVNSLEMSFPFTVQPPPWRTPGAYVAYVFATLAVFAMVLLILMRRAEVAKQIAAANTQLRQEVAERQAKERALEEERATTQRYLDVVEVIMIALSPDGRVTMINAKGLRVLATNEADAIGCDFCDTFVPADQRAEVRHRLTAPEKYQYSEWRLQPTSGTDRLIAWQSIRLPHNEEGGGLLISGTDVTQIRDLEGQLRDAQKMEALGTLARGVAHDFNNILSAIIGYTELTQKELTAQEPAQEHLRQIGASVTRARDLIQRILTFGRVAALHPRTVSITESIADAIQLVRPVLPREVRLTTQLDTDCGMVLADPSQLVQIVLNLCTNAAQSMAGDGGTLEVRLENCTIDSDTARALSLNRGGSFARLRVLDSGPGMDDYTLSRIFEPFFTTREQGEGTGLGLAVVHGIVGSLSGAIQVTSNLGRGTQFDVYLPHLADTGMTEISGITVANAQPEGGETILFVDDETAITTIAARGLGILGYNVITAHDANEAIRQYEAHSKEIDIVVTDQTMPGMLGEDLAKVLKTERPELPIVLISGADHPSGPHIDSFVAKPFTSEQLAQAIREALVAKRVA